MIQCDIKGCDAFESTLIAGSKEKLSHWVVLRSCQCGAYDGRKPKSCTCRSDAPVPTSFWPNLDWWALGGVDKITLCPDHKVLVMHEIERQRGLDPSMDEAHRTGRHNPTNRH